MSMVGLPMATHVAPHFGKQGRCCCPCDKCTIRLTMECVCEDCTCENSEDDHELPDGYDDGN